MPSPVADSPFAVLTLMAAPAVFTNAASLLALGTGNRLGRVVDRTRYLTRELHNTAVEAETRRLWLSHLTRLEKRAALLVRALSFFYGAIGAFAAASLVALLGASLAASSYQLPYALTAGISFVAGAIGFIGLSVGCVLLVNETRLALRSTYEEAELAKSQFQ
jgi:hypothetical protein